MEMSLKLEKRVKAPLKILNGEPSQKELNVGLEHSDNGETYYYEVEEKMADIVESYKYANMKSKKAFDDTLLKLKPYLEGGVRIDFFFNLLRLYNFNVMGNEGLRRKVMKLLKDSCVLELDETQSGMPHFKIVDNIGNIGGDKK